MRTRSTEEYLLIFADVDGRTEYDVYMTIFDLPRHAILGALTYASHYDKAVVRYSDDVVLYQSKKKSIVVRCWREKLLVDLHKDLIFRLKKSGWNYSRMVRK